MMLQIKKYKYFHILKTISVGHIEPHYLLSLMQQGSWFILTALPPFGFMAEVCWRPTLTAALHCFTTSSPHLDSSQSTQAGRKSPLQRPMPRTTEQQRKELVLDWPYNKQHREVRTQTILAGWATLWRFMFWWSWSSEQVQITRFFIIICQLL